MCIDLASMTRKQAKDKFGIVLATEISTQGLFYKTIKY
jgi:hypothetical protein